MTLLHIPVPLPFSKVTADPSLTFSNRELCFLSKRRIRKDKLFYSCLVFTVKLLTLCEEPLLEYQLFSLFSPLQLKTYVVSLLLIPLFSQRFLNLLLRLDRNESSQRYYVVEIGSQIEEWDPNEYSCWGKGSSMISTSLLLIGEFRTTGS